MIDDENILQENLNLSNDMNIDEDEEVVVLNKQTISYEFPYGLSTTKSDAATSNYQPIVFKNYLPTDPNFIIEKLDYFEKISDIERIYEKKMKKSVKDFLNLEKNPLNIVPKKNNIDLKRNISEKLEKLNRKTEMAILEMIKLNIQKQRQEIEMDNDNPNHNDNDKSFRNNSTQREPELEQIHSIDAEKLLTATKLHMNMQETDIKNNYLNSDEEDVSSDYDKGL